MAGVKLLGRLIRRTFILLLMLGGAAVAYLHVAGFPPFLKKFVEDQFLRAGYVCRFHTIRLDIVRGVIATDAVLADAKTSEKTLARIDEVELQINWRRLMLRENAVGALRIANATLSVASPPDEVGPAQFTASDAFATVRFEDDGAIQIEQLTGVYCGISLRVSGRVKPRKVAAAPTAPRAGERRFTFVTKALRELNSIHVTTPPQLDIDFDLDLDQPLDGHLKLRLSGVDIEYRGVRVDTAGVDVKTDGGAITVSKFLLQLGDGELSVTGRYDIAMSRFDLHLVSTVDPTTLASAMPPKMAEAMRELRVEENPIFVAQYTLSPETGSLPRFAGTVQTGGLEFRGVPFRSVSFAFEQHGSEIRFSDAAIVMAEGRLLGHGAYHINSRSFSYEINSTLNPRKLLALMTPRMRETVEPSWFDTPPRIVAQVSGDFVNPEALAYDATITARRCSYRGVALKDVAAALQLRDSVLTVQPLVLARRDGSLSGMLVGDFARHRVAFDIQTTANPTEMAPLLGPKAAEMMQAYRFGPRTEATARGVVDFDDPTQTTWEAQVANDGFSWWKLTADSVRGMLTFTNSAMHINNLEADIYGGKLRGRAAFAMTNSVAYTIEFSTERCDVHKLLTATRRGGSTTSGQLTGRAVFRGQGDDLETLSGRGDLEITDGVLWETPLFGVFSHILNEIGPGLGTTKLTSAKATFTIDDNAVSTDDLMMSAGAFTITSRGKVTFDGKLDFRVKGQLLKDLPGVNFITWFLKNVFEYKVGGTLSNPTYRAANMPKELLPHGQMGDKNGDKPAEN